MSDARTVVAAQQAIARERRAHRAMKSVLIALKALERVLDQAERDAAEARIPRSEFHVFLGDSLSRVLRPYASCSGRIGGLQLASEKTQEATPSKLRLRLEGSSHA